MKIAFLGDIAFIGKYDAAQHGIDQVMKRFEKILPVLNGCDYVIANLESPLTDVRATHEAKTLALRADRINVEVLTRLGINAVSLSNNHIFDYGKKGYEETVRTLQDAGISYYGIGNNVYTIEKGKTNVRFGGYCCLTANGWHYDIHSNKGTLNTLSKQNLEAFIKQCERDKCFPIISPHWGEENTHYPRLEHLKLADHLCEKVNIAFVGHHPHVVQGIKEYKNGSIAAFSLGNFCFDDNESDTGSGVSVKQTEENLKGVILILEIQERSIMSSEAVTYYDGDTGLVVSDQVKNELLLYSDAISSNIDAEVFKQTRSDEIKAAHSQRLGNRDMTWLVGHMNSKAVRAVLQRKKNQKVFQQISLDF